MKKTVFLLLFLPFFLKKCISDCGKLSGKKITPAFNLKLSPCIKLGFVAGFDCMLYMSVKMSLVVSGEC